jgi:antitoxin component of MazEF toxin-antitoxin module
MKQKVIKAGNSLAVTIPSKFAKTIGIKLATDVEVELEPETGKMVLTFSGVRQLTLVGK